MKPAPMMYYQPYLVPVWVLVENDPKSKKVVKWFAKNEANVQEWPAVGYKQTYDSFGNNGWGHVVNKPGPRHTDLLVRAFTEQCKKQNPYVQMSTNHNSVMKANRDLVDEKDFEAFFNKCMDFMPLMDLSKLFYIQEICYPTLNTGCKVWVSSDTFDYTTVSRLAKKVVLIGNPKEGQSIQPDITFDELGKDFGEVLEMYMEDILSKVSLSKV